MIHKEILRTKYMTWSEDGEICSFNSDYLQNDEFHLLTDCTELFESGIYFSNNNTIVDQLTVVLDRESIQYELHGSIGWKFKLKIF